MPRTVEVLSVFVASPSDVAEEREILEGVVDQFNLTTGSASGVRLELVRWETHVTPRLGPDPQAIVNEAIGENYDIFIGILWSRFGTPTPRAGSGTEEEFLRAYERMRAGNDSVHLMMYFKEAAIPISAIDPEQITLLKSFRKNVEQLGIVGVFTDKEAFAELLRLHLFGAVQAWQQRRKEKSYRPQPITDPTLEGNTNPEDLNEDLGLLDLTEAYEDSLARTNSLLGQIGVTIHDLGERVTSTSSELTTAARLGIQMDRSEMKRVFKRVADVISSSARVLEADVPLYAEFQKAGLVGMARAVPLYVDFGEQGRERLNEGLEMMRTLQPIIRTAAAQISGLRASTLAVPRISTDVNQARRRLRKILDQLIQEMETGENLAKEIENTILRTLEGMDEDPRSDPTV